VLPVTLYTYAYIANIPCVLHSRLTLHYTNMIRDYTLGTSLDISNTLTIDTVHQCALHVHFILEYRGVFRSLWYVLTMFYVELTKDVYYNARAFRVDIHHALTCWRMTTGLTSPLMYGWTKGCFYGERDLKWPNFLDTNTGREPIVRECFKTLLVREGGIN